MSDYCGNYSVKAKVAMVMAAVLFAAAALGIFAIRELWSVNVNAADIRDNWLPSTRICIATARWPRSIASRLVSPTQRR